MAQFERASNERMAQFEQAILRLSVKPESPPSASVSRGVDLQRFRLSDGPVFRGPFHVVKPCLTWFNALEVFFDRKGITPDTDKIRIAGGLVQEPNTLAFYTNNVATHVTLSWATFK